MLEMFFNIGKVMPLIFISYDDLLIEQVLIHIKFAFFKDI